MVLKTPSHKGKGDLFHLENRISKNGQGQKFGLPKGVESSIPQPGLMGSFNLFGLVQDARKESQGQRNHQADSTRRQERGRLKNPDHDLTKITGPCDGGKKKGIAHHQAQAPRGPSSQKKTLSTDRKPVEKRKPDSGGQKNLKQKKHQKKERPESQIFNK